MRPAWRRQYVRYRRLFLNFFAQYKERQDLKMFLEILLSLTTVSFFALVALRPTLLTIAGLIKEIDTKKEVIEQMDEKISKLNRAKALYNQEAARIELLKTSIPPEPAPDAFIRQIEGLSGKHSSGILSLTIEEVTLIEEKPAVTGSGSTPLGAAEELGFSLSTSSDYPSLFSYLADLEKMRRPIKMDFFTMRSSTAQGAFSLILVVEGKVPYLKIAEDISIE